MKYKRKEQLLEGTTQPIESSKFIENHTLKIHYKSGDYAIRLHNTDVVTYKLNGDIILNSGGWKTPTTKERINSFSPFFIYQEKHIWYVVARANRNYIDKSIPFYDGITFNTEGELISEARKVDWVKEIELKRKIKEYINLITKENLPLPQTGDCWFCLFKNEEGKTMGDLSSDHSHLLSHMEEGYLHGSILFNAMREKGYRQEQVYLHYRMGMTDSFKRALRHYLNKRLIGRCK